MAVELLLVGVGQPVHYDCSNRKTNIIRSKVGENNSFVRKESASDVIRYFILLHTSPSWLCWFFVSLGETLTSSAVLIS